MGVDYENGELEELRDAQLLEAATKTMRSIPLELRMIGHTALEDESSGVGEECRKTLLFFRDVNQCLAQHK